MRQLLKHLLPKNVRVLLLRIERSIRLLVRPQVLADLHTYRSKEEGLSSGIRFSTNLKDIFPITGEATKYTSFDRHYVYHTAWAARVISEIQPESHTDISSSLYLPALVSAFIPVHFYDYRPASLTLSDLTMNSGDLMKLPFADMSKLSISCLHTIEHVGLGRYGDPIDPQGDIKALKELRRVVQSGGNLLLVVPVGKKRIEFNAHRIYNPKEFADLVLYENEVPTGFTLKEYAYIPETDAEGPLIRNANIDRGADAHYACGCFWFVRE